jgi:glycosyltransferase involved in cell wall biosynthesis
MGFFVLAFIQVTWLHGRHRYAVVQIANLPDFLVFAALIPKLTGSSLLLDLHDLMPEFFQSRFGRRHRVIEWLVRRQEQLSCRFADHVLTVTELWRQTLIQRGVRPGKCSVLLNVADDRVFQPLALPPQAAEPPGEGVHFIYHGNFTYRYGVDLLLRALAQARCALPNSRLTLHGWGESLLDLQALAHELGLTGIVTFSTELLPIESLPRLLSTADAGIIPYRRDVFTDGILPTKLMEYAALGLAVIAVRTPVIEAYFEASMLETFENGDVEGLARALIRLARDPGRRLALARNIREFNVRFNWQAQRSAYLALVAQLVQGGAARAHRQEATGVSEPDQS